MAEGGCPPSIEVEVGLGQSLPSPATTVPGVGRRRLILRVQWPGNVVIGGSWVPRLVSFGPSRDGDSDACALASTLRDRG
jgi:hypothetical protein